MIAVLVMLCAVPFAHAQTSVSLSSLTGPNGLTITGTGANDLSGYTFSAGDVNGDGIDDVIIGAPLADPGGLNNAGAVYVVFGKAAAFSSPIDLSSLDGGTGFALNGAAADDRAGQAVASGDINGDGVDDVITGAPHADASGLNRAGAAYVVFGKTTAFDPSIDLGSLDGTTGFALNGAAADDRVGHAVSAGDINGDGVDDVITGAPYADPGGLNHAGAAYVVFGKAAAFAASIDLGSLDGTTGFALNGAAEGDENGWSVSAGDINGDGVDDVITGARYSDASGLNNAGAAYVVFGKTTAFDPSIDLGSLDGSTGFALNGVAEGDESGWSVSAGDINGDGVDDVITGARLAAPGGKSRAGAAYVVFGKAAAFAASIDLSSLDGGTGFALNGVATDDRAGQAVASGDINGDGVDDVLIGARFADPGGLSDSGAAYVVFGKATAFAASIDLGSLDGTTGFALNGVATDDQTGQAVSSGDINGDGVDDVITGAPFFDLGGIGNAGATYVFFNKMSQLITGNEGFRTLSAPVSGTVYDDLLDGFFTQGFTNSDAPSADANVWTFNQATQQFEGLTDQNADNLAAGHGFLWFAYSDDNGPGTPGDAGFPKRLSATQFGGNGTANAGTVSPTTGLNNGEFFFAGNPYGFTIDWDDTDITKTNLSNTIYIYDDANSTFQSWNGTTGNITGGLIEPFQGFFIEGFGGSGALSMTEGAIADTSGTFFKQISDAQPRALKLTATAGDFQADAWLSFQEGGELGRDPFDGLYLQPYSPTYLRLATQLDDTFLQINAVPVDYDQDLVYPLNLAGTVSEVSATLSIEGLEDFGDWNVFVRDNQTGNEFPLHTDEDVIELDIERINTKRVPALQTPTPTRMKETGNGSRYELVLQQGISVSTEGPGTLPTVVTLKQNFPNPFNPTTNISFTLPQAGQVRLQVFDLLGRKVATLVNDRRQAGSFTVQFDASSFSSGVYIYRLQAGGTVLTRKLTLIK